jgi:hypothetical protein
MLCICFFAVVISLSACKAPEDKVLMSLGEYKNNEYYTEGEFQDYTDYAKYYYDFVDFTENEYFNKIREADLTKINEHLADFELWIEIYRENDSSLEIVVNYDFDRSIIDSEDYIYIDSEKITTTGDDGTTTLANYDIYFYDTQTQILYYFHNNK